MAAALTGAGVTFASAVLARKALQSPRETSASEALPVTVLRPIKGAEPGLEEALWSALEQDYPGEVQVVCGIEEAEDAAGAVVRDLQCRAPDRDVHLVAGGHTEGANRKIANLSNMLTAAKHDLLIVADADIVVPAAWLWAAVSTLSRPAVGLVTCYYVGEGLTAWGRVVAMGTSYQFLPNTVLGVATGLAQPCFGSTIALRRETLAQIGGFERFRNSLADDREIGDAVRRNGFAVAYPRLLVRHLSAERTLRELWGHELRWARTVRTANPLGYLGSIITYPLPLALIGAILGGFSWPALVILATVMATRLFLKSRIDHIAGFRTGPAWLLPVRDLLSFGVFLNSLVGRTVDWRGTQYRIDEHGAISQGG
ncbi:MAG: bacteriohopanetetrol glucosamine biosynthesis glycosyltransferase HpnI [Alphaproteobacteria bacterium]|nr:bacteriohopanetetrol glucosamine biosynthesis glycosyltransferase HpnI [Alphaproteobacteria bacterium]